MVDNTIQAWLELQCELLSGSLRAVVLIGDPAAGPVLPAATWPATAASTPGLLNAAASALQQKRIVVRPKTSAPEAVRQQGEILAVPVRREQAVIGVVSVEVSERSPEDLKALAKILARNTVWLELLVRETPAVDDSPMRALVDLVAACVEETQFEAAATATMTRLATLIGCERVSLGFVRRNKVEVRTISGTATLNPKMLLTRSIGKAMDEAIGQDTTVLHPQHDEKSYFTTRYHEELSRSTGGGAVCTVPFSRDDSLVGAITFEHEGERAFDQKTITLCETAVSLIAPILNEKLLHDRPLFVKFTTTLTQQLGKFATPGHLLLKAGAAASFFLVVFLATATGEYRVNADALLEGTVQRLVVAPIDGFIKEAAVRAGDIVEEGQLLARLDDKDLELELREQQSERAKLQREYRQAMSELDSARVRILKAQLDQVAARIELTAKNLERTRATSPMAGLIISGDLSQSLGTPVTRGDALFEIAPLDSYRVMLQVDEEDVRDLKPGQTGQLALVGFPDEPLPFAIQRVTPIATAMEGRNFFTVEAQLKRHPERLRPGMTGVGKVDIGPQKLIWIWTHRLLDWLRLQAWIWTA